MGCYTGKRKYRLAATPDRQRNHDLALSLSKGGPRAPSVLRQAQHGVGGLGRQGQLRLQLRVNTLAWRYGGIKHPGGNSSDAWIGQGATFVMDRRCGLQRRHKMRRRILTGSALALAVFALGSTQAGACDDDCDRCGGYGYYAAPAYYTAPVYYARPAFAYAPPVYYAAPAYGYYAPPAYYAPSPAYYAPPAYGSSLRPALLSWARRLCRCHPQWPPERRCPPGQRREARDLRLRCQPRPAGDQGPCPQLQPSESLRLSRQTKEAGKPCPCRRLRRARETHSHRLLRWAGRICRPAAVADREPYAARSSPGCGGVTRLLSVWQQRAGTVGAGARRPGLAATRFAPQSGPTPGCERGRTPAQAAC